MLIIKLKANHGSIGTGLPTGTELGNKSWKQCFLDAKVRVPGLSDNPKMSRKVI